MFTFLEDNNNTHTISNMDNSLPYKVSYAVGNERCRKCNCLIQSECLQIAIMDQVISFIMDHNQNII